MTQTAKEILKPGEQLLWAVCHDCRKKHPLKLRPGVQDNELQDWWVKHLGHRIEFRQEDPFSHYSPLGLGERVIGYVRDWFRGLRSKGISRRFDASLPFLSYEPNTNDKIAYGSSAALTWTLASLASSATLVAGRESTKIDNTTNLYYDYLFGGFSTVGTTPTANTLIEIWAGVAQDDTPTWPSLVTTGLTGADAAVTAVSAGVKANTLTPITAIAVPAATSNVQYNMAPIFLFNGCSPKYWNAVLFHSTAVNLNSTAGNHVWSQTGQYGTS
jgi:hypothetical protein